MFDKYYKPVRNLIKGIDDKYKGIFKHIKHKAYSSVENIYLFIDFLKLFISQEKFVKISTLFNTQNNNTKSKANIEEIDEEEEDQMKPEKIIEDIDNRIRIKKIIDIKEENIDLENKKHFNNRIDKNIDENILLAFSLDPFQLIVIIFLTLGCH